MCEKYVVFAIGWAAFSSCNLLYTIMPPQQPSQRNEIIDWYNSIPPITKALFTLSIATTTVSTLGLISPSSLILYWPAIKMKLQVKRNHDSLLYTQGLLSLID